MGLACGLESLSRQLVLAPATWASFGTWFAWSWPKPYTYDYGNTVVYRDNYVYVDGQQQATADAYYDQAVSIAQSVPENLDAEKVEWMPLGVFAIAEDTGDGSVANSDMLIQLAVSKEGVIAGTFWNDTTDNGLPLEGMVNEKTQRAGLEAGGRFKSRFGDGDRCLQPDRR